MPQRKTEKKLKKLQIELAFCEIVFYTIYNWRG